MGKNILSIIKNKDVGSIGIGAMIVFIAMVLVAGIAASVLIQTSTSLESQAMLTGEATTREVSAGIYVVNIEGHNTSGRVDLLAIMVRPRAGSDDIDLGETIIEISDSLKKNVLVYDESTCVQPNETLGDLFNAANYGGGATKFGIIVLEDADGSCSTGSSAVINSGDYVLLTVDASSCFTGGGFAVRSDVWGMVIPEEGSPGVISFRVPSSLTNDVVELQ
jgi:flagellin FlaB